MRQLKNFMKAKKPMWRCGECKCLTLQCRKENDELCNCGENVSPQPVPPTPVTDVTITFGEDDGWVNSITQEPVTSRTVPAGTKLTLGRLDYDMAEVVIGTYPPESASSESEYELIDRFVNTSGIKVNGEYLMFREPIEVNEDVTVTIDGDESLYELELQQFGGDVGNWELGEHQQHIAISEGTPVTLTNQEWNTVTITAGSYSATYTLSDESYHIASVITTDDPDDPQTTQYEVGTAIPFFSTMRATVVVEPSL